MNRIKPTPREKIPPNFNEANVVLGMKLFRTGSAISLWRVLYDWAGRLPQLARPHSFLDAAMMSAWSTSIVNLATFFDESSSTYSLKDLIELGGESDPTGSPFLPLNLKSDLLKELEEARALYKPVKLLRHNFEAHMGKGLSIIDEPYLEAESRKLIEPLFQKSIEVFHSIERAAGRSETVFPDFAQEIGDDLAILLEMYPHLRGHE